MTTDRNLDNVPSTHGADRPEPAPRRRRRWPRRAAITLLIPVLLLGGLYVTWGRTAARAFSRELAAYRAAGEPVTVQELNEWVRPRSPGENAVPTLRAAAAAIDVKTDAWVRVDRSQDDFVPPLRDREVAALEALVEENEAALRLMDEAEGKPGVDWDLRLASPMINEQFPDLKRQRYLVNLLRDAALLEHHRGNHSAALRRLGQMEFVGRAADYLPTFITHLMAMGIHAVAAHHTARLAPDLRIATGADAPGPGGGAAPAQVRALIGLLLDEKPLAEGQRRSWVGERVLQLDSMDTLAADTVTGGPPSGLTRAKLFVMRPYFNDNARMMASYTTSLMRATAECPDVGTFRQRFPDDMPKELESPRYALSRVLLPSLNRGGEQHYRMLADRRLAATCLAVRLYAAEHDGRLPKTLNDLVPDYLPAVPLDPLVTGARRPLGYVGPEADPQRPRVYSVGPNGIDQGGAEPDARLPRRESEAQRDEVRHLKRQPRPERKPEQESEGVAFPHFPGQPGTSPGGSPPEESEVGSPGGALPGGDAPAE